MSISIVPPVQYSSTTEILNILINHDFGAFENIFKTALFPGNEKDPKILAVILPTFIASLLRIHVLGQKNGHAIWKIVGMWKQEDFQELAHLSIDAIANDERFQTISAENLHSAINIVLNSAINEINNKTRVE